MTVAAAVTKVLFIMVAMDGDMKVTYEVPQPDMQSCLAHKASFVGDPTVRWMLEKVADLKVISADCEEMVQLTE
jgi:hypothetical protein